MHAHKHVPLFLEYIQIRDKAKRATHPKIFPDLGIPFSLATRTLSLTAHFSFALSLKEKVLIKLMSRQLVRQWLQFPVYSSQIAFPFDCIFRNANKEICLLENQLQLVLLLKNIFFPFPNALLTNHVYQCSKM